jgi:hypothetical protein
VIEGTVLHHENDDVLEFFDSGFGSVGSHSLVLTGFGGSSMRWCGEKCLQKSSVENRGETPAVGYVPIRR